MTAIEFRSRLEELGKLEACRAIDSAVNSELMADMFIWRYIKDLLNSDEYTGAAIVLFGDRIFNPRPISVQRIWSAISENALTLLQGAGGVGKTLTPIIWLLLDWLCDSEYTNIKLISATRGHAQSNAFSDLVRMHEASIIKLPGEVTANYVGLDSNNRKSGIAVIAIPEGSDGKGRLQGFHPHPRAKSHPKFGDSSRVRAYMDECEKIPVGIWAGIDNLKVSLHGSEIVKAIGSYNPHDQTTPTAKNAEPDGGWEMFDIERGVQGKDEWESKEGWFVCRIDGKKTENVMTGENVFPGLITREGYRNLEDKNGGNSVDYFVFARGSYPPEGAIGVVLPAKVYQDACGEFTFAGVTIKVAGVDTAIVQGGDNCVLSVGRSGMATAWQPKNGPLRRFHEPRRVLQLDQQYTVKKGDTKIVSDGIMALCLTLGVSPEYLCVDATGNGSAVYSLLKTPTYMGADVNGISFNDAATKMKILAQDQYLPEELYEGIVSEVWFALSRWMEFGYFGISPGCRKEPLESELTSRRYVIGAGKKQRVEKKDDWKFRLGLPSPDFADSATIFLHAGRVRTKIIGSMVDEKKRERDYRRPKTGERDRVQWFEDSAV